MKNNSSVSDNSEIILEIKDLRKSFDGNEILKGISTTIRKGDVLARLYTNKEETLDRAKEIFLSALEFSEQKPESMGLIIDRVE